MRKALLSIINDENLSLGVKTRAVLQLKQLNKLNRMKKQIKLFIKEIENLK